MTALAKRIAVLLANYEMDEPHYPSRIEMCMDDASLSGWLLTKHNGDCVSRPCPCRKCMADEWMHKGKWIADRLEEK